MNRKIGMTVSLVNAIAVAGFALSMLLGINFGSYLSSIFIALSFVPMICSYAFYAKMEKKFTVRTGGLTHKRLPSLIFSNSVCFLIMICWDML